MPSSPAVALLDSLEIQITGMRDTLATAADADRQRLVTQIQAIRAALLSGEPIPDPPPDPEPQPPGDVPTILVRAGDDLQQVLDNIAGPAIIRIQPNVIFHGNYRLRKKPVPDGYAIVLRPAADVPSPATAPWIDPSMRAFMPKFAAADPHEPALSADDGATRYHLLGLEMLPNVTMPDRDLMMIGRNETTDINAFPSHILLERMYFHGDPEKGGHRGLLFNVRNGVVKQSYFEKFIERGRDSQAICIISGPGPYLIESNYLEASGENFLIGGADPKITDLVPSDIVFRGNHCFKPKGWQSQFPSTVKNLFELKNARRVLIENNVFENCWADQQAGHGVVFTVRNQDGTAPWSTIDDVVCQYNIIRNVTGMAINMLGSDYSQPSARGKNMRIAQNLLIDTNGLMLNRQMMPTHILHNSLIGLATKFLQFVDLGMKMDLGTLFVRDNVFSSAVWPIAGEGTGIGTPTLEAYAPGYTFDYNVIERGPEFIPLPAGNTMVPHGMLASRLSNYRYTGGELGSDGQPLGADVEEIRRRIPWYSF